MWKLTFSCLMLCLSLSLGANIFLKDKLAEAEPGSYIVLEQNKIFTFLHIYSKEGGKIILEEVSIPASSFQSYRCGFKEWFESGAPGHTGWLLSEINLKTGMIEEAFSFTHQGWVDMSDSSVFLNTLLNLSFSEVPAQERRRVGSPPGYNRPDHRPIWHPRLIVEGQCIPRIPFTAYKARWPSDSSELSRKTIEIYLPDPSAGYWYPAYFPYWLEVDGKIGSAKIRVVDSGLSAESPKESFPRRH